MDKLNWNVCSLGIREQLFKIVKYASGNCEFCGGTMKIEHVIMRRDKSAEQWRLLKEKNGKTEEKIEIDAVCT